MPRLTLTEEANAAPTDQVVETRPGRTPIMHHNWGKLLFLHWPITVTALRPLIPSELEIETFDGNAWITMTPFTMWGIRPTGLPPIPLLSAAHELNVRTYVRHKDTSGIWFFSLDINHSLGALVGRWGFSLPYYRATIIFEEFDGHLSFRLHRREPSAEFEAQWTPGQPQRLLAPGSIDSFLLERYFLFSWDGRRLWRGPIAHTRWLAQPVEDLSYRSTMLRPHGLTAPDAKPLMHYAETKRVHIYAIEAA